jgi:AcrR family transcriptional regulator
MTNSLAESHHDREKRRRRLTGATSELGPRRSARPRRRAGRLPADVRREQILDRALDLVQRDGLANLTMKKVTRRVGFSEAAIYRHFPTKGALLLGLFDRLDALLLVPIRAIAEDRSATPAERLTRILQHHIALVIERDSLPILLLAEVSSSGDAALVARMRRLLLAYLDVLQRLLAEAGVPARPDGPDPTGLALLLVGLPAAVAIHHRLRPDAPAERAMADALAPFLVGCLTSVGRKRS